MENLENLQNFNFNELYANLTDSLKAGGFVVYAIVAGLLLIFALFGYKLQKACIALACAAGVAVFSLSFCIKIFENETMGYVAAGVLALITFLVIFKLYIKIVALAVAIAGGAVAYIALAPGIAQKVIELAGDSIPMLDSIVKVFVALVAGAICAVLAKLVFKWLVIIATAFGGAAGAMYNVALMAGQEFNTIFIVLAVLIGIGCCIFQIKNNKYSE